MKRTFLFLATFAAVAVGCSKNALVDAPEVVYDGSSINFAPSTGLSKANDKGLEELKGSGFEVHALVKDGANPAKLYFTKPTQIGSGSEILYSFKGGTWGWVRSDTKADKVWPTDATKYPMTFIAASGTGVDFRPNYDLSAGSYIWSKEITQGVTTEATEDILSAVTIQPSAPMSGQLASLQFKHIMSNIKFNVMIPTGYTVYVTRAIYHNLHNVNTYDFLKQTWATLAPAAGTVSYVYQSATMQELVGAGDALSIATTDDVTIKAIPQNFATAWDLAAFKTAAADWKTAGGNKADWPTAEATAALATGTYVELQYALVDNNGVCVVGRIDGKKYIDAAGATVLHTGDNQLLRVAYIVDLTKVNSGLEPAKLYTYQIALGTANATGGTVLDPTYMKEDGTTPGEDNDKEPGDDVNNKATEIGFSVDVENWTGGTASFEPIPVP